MIDLVAGYARGYDAAQVRPFLRSLRETGYKGAILMIADGGAAEEAARWGADVRPVGALRIKVHSDRILRWEEELAGIPCQGVLLADTRDVFFQEDPSATLPSEGLHAFLEDDRMTLESCPYNSSWIRQGYGEDMLGELGSQPISCVGTTCGDRDSILQYLRVMREEVERIQPKTRLPQDQAAHNIVIRRKMKARLWPNEEGEVYTVGYCLRGSVHVECGEIVNVARVVPTVIHQWDRHLNLKALVENRWL